PRHGAGSAHRHPAGAHRVASRIWRAPSGGCPDLRIPADDDPLEGAGRRRSLHLDRVDQLRRALDVEERGGGRLFLRSRARGVGGGDVPAGRPRLQGDHLRRVAPSRSVEEDDGDALPALQAPVLIDLIDGCNIVYVLAPSSRYDAFTCPRTVNRSITGR